MSGNRHPAGAFLALVTAVVFVSCTSLPQPTPPRPSLTPTATPFRKPAATPTLTPSPSPSPEPTMPPESPIDTARWTGLSWTQGTIEMPSGASEVHVSDVARWGEGFIAVGFNGAPNSEPPPDALIWLSADGLRWDFVSDESDVFAGAALCCVMRARDAFIAWTARSSVFLSSPDGREWTRTKHDGGGVLFAATETDDGLFGYPRGDFDGTVWTTSDGHTWQARKSTGLHLLLGGFGGASLLATKFGFFAAGEATEGGVHGPAGDWGNWFSPGGLQWQEIEHVDSQMGFNARSFEEGHNSVYAYPFINSGVYFADWPALRRLRTTDGQSWSEAESDGFPEVGRYDGRFTLDLSGITEGQPARLSEDGIAIQALATLGEDVPAHVLGLSAIGPAGVVVFSGASPVHVWFGSAVTEPPTAKPSVYCGPLDSATCLRLVGDVASSGQLRPGAAFIVEWSCYGFFECWDPQIAIVAVPPDWETAGGLRRWDYDPAADVVSSRSSSLIPTHIRANLPTNGPWNSPVVGDHVWIHLGNTSWEVVKSVLGDHGLRAVAIEPDTEEPVGWLEAEIVDARPPTPILTALLRDRRVCAADYVRFDGTLSSGAADAALLPPPDVVGCAAPASSVAFDLPVNDGHVGCTLQLLGASVLGGWPAASPPARAIGPSFRVDEALRVVGSS